MYNSDRPTYIRTHSLIDDVYDCLRTNGNLDSIHIPHSDVFYVREALEERFKCPLSLEQVEEYMKEVGWRDTGESKEQDEGVGA